MHLLSKVCEEQICIIWLTKPAKKIIYSHYLMIRLDQWHINIRHVIACATMLGCLHYYIVLRALLYYATIVIALVYCTFLKEVRLGRWGTEGPQAPSLGRHVSACPTILRLRALVYLPASH